MSRVMKPVPASRPAPEPAPPPHPLAGTTMSGADAILQVLADEGVDAIFGYSGGAILPTYDAVFRYNANHPKDEEIRLIVPATEQAPPNRRRKERRKVVRQLHEDHRREADELVGHDRARRGSRRRLGEQRAGGCGRQKTRRTEVPAVGGRCCLLYLLQNWGPACADRSFSGH